MTIHRSSRQHRAVLSAPAVALPEGERPEAGPIALLPRPKEAFADAVAAGGGVVEELSERTRGLIWLSSKHPEQLAEALRSHPGIGWVQLPWAGVDAFADVIAAEARPGLVWTSAKGAYAEPVAEHALTLALALLRVIPTRVRARSWSTVAEGRSLYRLNVTIIGAGGIALELLRLLTPFDVTTTVVRRSASPVDGADVTVQVDRLREALADADVVIVAAAATDATAQLIGERELAAMRQDAVLVNIARGSLVDTAALVRALDDGRIAGAGLDVTDPEPLPDGHPLWSEPACIITPHSADTPDMTAPLLAERIQLNVEALLGDGRFVGIVDPVAGY
ncbi:hydroxyacid dehydrogenase [Microbacterium sp. STN6]|uniref:NAD(P)-dependent oxidoreductase n=1 Tax=Microbacterium sp. STN6 TaxID=2995588 RepID=UPI002260D7D4|nr:NAD(P)-dependent oxidoreductase [Microbacterium sp. STN6]MCX7522336.1 hydroxyacid dehydrogenase [Microbacterium sp. STN6]